MPNDCENYIEIHATDLDNGPTSLQQLLELPSFDPFKIFPPPAELLAEDMNNYRYVKFGTKWVYQLIDKGDGDVGSLCNGVDFLYLFFNSAWAPPEKFYKLLVQKYPGIKVKFEYNEWQLGFCGHGEYDATTEPDAEPIHYNFDNTEELIKVQQAHKWTLVPWSPYFIEESPYNSSDDDLNDLEDDSE